MPSHWPSDKRGTHFCTLGERFEPLETFRKPKKRPWLRLATAAGTVGLSSSSLFLSVPRQRLYGQLCMPSRCPLASIEVVCERHLVAGEPTTSSVLKRKQRTPPRGSRRQPIEERLSIICTTCALWRRLNGNSFGRKRTRRTDDRWLVNNSTPVARSSRCVCCAAISERPSTRRPGNCATRPPGNKRHCISRASRGVFFFLLHLRFCELIAPVSAFQATRPTLNRIKSISSPIARIQSVAPD